MRTLLWVLTGIGALLVILSVQVLRDPDHPIVITEILNDWFGKQMIWSALIGTVVGAVGAYIAMRSVRHRPRVPAVRFLERVAAVGFGSMIAGSVLTGLVAAYMAASADFGPVGPSEKVQLVLTSGKSLGILGAAWLGCGVAFALTTRAVRWGGQHAVVGPFPRSTRS